MAGSKAKKIIQVPIERELLKRIHTSAGAAAQRRAAFIRGACRQRLKSLEAEELDWRYVAGYQKKPEDLAWAKVAVGLPSKRLPKEKW